jgi:hypothetical protein
MATSTTGFAGELLAPGDERYDEAARSGTARSTAGPR